MFRVHHCLASPTDPERSHLTIRDLHPLSRRIRHHDCSPPVAAVKDGKGIIANHDREPRVKVEWALLDVDAAVPKVLNLGVHLSRSFGAAAESLPDRTFGVYNFRRCDPAGFLRQLRSCATNGRPG